MPRLQHSAAFALAALLALSCAAPAARAADWVDTAIPWYLLPSKTAAGPLPQVFSIPAKAWDYGASSAAANVFAKTDAAILRVDLEAKAGQVGVSMMTGDGAHLLSKEKVLTPQMGAAHVFFRVLPGAVPSIVVLRNYDADGRPGSVSVTRTQFVPESKLTNEELRAVVQDGLL